MEALQHFRHGKAVSQINTLMGVARVTVEVYILDSLLVADSSSDYQRLYNEFNLKREDYDLVVQALDWLLKHKFKITLSEIKRRCDNLPYNIIKLVLIILIKGQITPL